MGTPAQLAVLNRPISHISYAVEDIEAAVTQWSTLMGAGPFFLIDRVRFDEVTTRAGLPAVWEHAAAFGQWGSLCIELQQLDDVRPPQLRELLTPGDMPVVNHVAYVSDTPEDDSAELTAAGYDLFLHAVFGRVEVWFHDTRAVLGHAVEIHRASPQLTEAFQRIADAARDWDGSLPLRPMGHTP